MIKWMLDLYCGGGGAAMGYYRAFGPEVNIVGIDIEPMPHYPFFFIQDDALEYVKAHGHLYDFIHASPPCQAYTAMQHIHHNSDAHPDLLGETREVLQSLGTPYIIENVPGAPINGQLMLCGTMFGLRIIRHRYFESNWLPLVLMPPCDHRDVFDPWHGTGRTANQFREAMGIDWIPDVGGGGSQGTRQGTLKQAIPPAYTEWIGQQLLEILAHERMEQEERQQQRYDYNTAFVEAMT